ncbi:MAG: hypothetical protein JW797_06890 [Bradymonadales bacterium]|nr:hypothetical protein [Bradymonadales bacterium]
MDSRDDSLRWTEQDVAERLAEVQQKLLAFLRERTSLDLFKHKVRWSLSRRYIWPGDPGDTSERLKEAVEQDGGVEALMDHLDRWKKMISQAIERYNWAVKRWMEQEQGRKTSDFDEQAKQLLVSRQITFEGISQELLACAAQVTAQSEPEVIPELLSLRLAILNEEDRNRLISEAAAAQAATLPGVTPDQKEMRAFEIEQWLHCCDQYHVADKLAKSYNEARRFLEIDRLFQRHDEEIKAEREAPQLDPNRERRIQVLREMLFKKIGYLEQLYPRSKGTHKKDLDRLRILPGAHCPE